MLSNLRGFVCLVVFLITCRELFSPATAVAQSVYSVGPCDQWISQPCPGCYPPSVQSCEPFSPSLSECYPCDSGCFCSPPRHPYYGAPYSPWVYFEDTLNPPNALGGGHSLRQPLVVTDGTSSIPVPRHFSRIAQNNSPLPRTQISESFNLLVGTTTFSNPAAGQSSRNLQQNFIRYEQALSRRISLEAILPVVEETENNINFAAGNPGTEFSQGDISFGGKFLLYSGDESAISMGLRFDFPTSDNVSAVFPGGIQASFDNRAVAITPYLAMVVRPLPNLYFQQFVSYRAVAGSDQVTISGPGGQIGSSVRESSLLMIDSSLYWNWLSTPSPDGLVTGFGPLFELAYTATTDGGPLPYGDSNLFDFTLGFNMQFRSLPDEIRQIVPPFVPPELRDGPASLAFGFTFPLRSSETRTGAYSGPTDRYYDWAFMLQATLFTR